MRLGDIIDRLSELPQDAEIWYDFEAGVGEFFSWRGAYQDLTLAPSGDKSIVRDVLKRAVKAVGETFTGYKGGEYKMNENTPVWADPCGDVTSRMILSIDQVLNGYVIRTFVKPLEYIW